MRRGFMAVFLQTPIYTWRGRRGVLQPSKLAAVGCAEVEMCRECKRMSLPGSDLQFALACVESAIRGAEAEQCRGCVQVPIFSSR